MKVLNNKIALNDFFARLAESRQRILMLDYDGTLAPFKTKRDEAVPYKGVEELLNAIMETQLCRVVLVSGRWTKDLLKLIHLNRRPEIWGSHGWERMLPDSSCRIAAIPEHALKALTCAEDWLQQEGLYELCEPKPACVALHWRGLGQRRIELIKEKVKDNWFLIPHSNHLELKEFDGGFEFRIPGKNKGDAVRQILSESDADCAAAYLGDDTTDEDAFHELEGKGLRILVRRELRSTSADIWLVPPEELLLFLGDWRDACKV